MTANTRLPIPGQSISLIIMINVIATIKTKPGKREEVLAAFAEIIPAVLEEEGCIEYGPAIDAINAPPMQTPLGLNTFVVIEKWSSNATLDAHSKSSQDRIIHVLAPKH